MEELNRVGRNQLRDAAYPAASENFIKALNLLDQPSCHSDILKAATLRNLAQVYHQVGGLDQAQRAEELARQLVPD